MQSTNTENRLSLNLATSFLLAILTLVAGCSNDSPRFEYIHMEGAELGYNMPYTPAIKVHSGKLVFVSGVTAAPVYHSHPHVPSEFDHLDFSAGAQATQTMENLRIAVEAAGGQLTDIVHLNRFMVDQAADQDAINAAIVAAWDSDHRPASTSVEIPRLATDPRLLLEISAIAVVPD